VKLDINEWYDSDICYGYGHGYRHSH